MLIYFNILFNKSMLQDVTHWMFQRVSICTSYRIIFFRQHNSKLDWSDKKFVVNNKQA